VNSNDGYSSTLWSNLSSPPIQVKKKWKKESNKAFYLKGDFCMVGSRNTQVQLKAAYLAQAYALLITALQMHVYDVYENI